MLTIVKGDLLKSDCDIIAHQCNCQGVMGSGIAKQIRLQFPEAYQAFKDDDRTPREKLGTFTRGYNTSCNLDRAIFCYNLYGQLHFGRFNVLYTDYHALGAAINRMLLNVKEREKAIYNAAGGPPRLHTAWKKLREGTLFKIGLPYGIGCGLANGEWKMVEGIIENASVAHGREIFLYQL
jgi:hypothetical protein